MDSSIQQQQQQQKQQKQQEKQIKLQQQQSQMMMSTSTNDHLVCKYLEPHHDLNDAKILPCGETVCNNCISKSLDSSSPTSAPHIEKCALCGQAHQLKDIIPNKLVNSLLEAKRVIADRDNKTLANLKKMASELTGLLCPNLF